jgi:5-methylcytosine-specific restriction endonuclease McrA
MGLKNYDRHSAAVIRSARWKVVRLAAKRRDGWKCVDCGARGRLEVHHIKRVKDFPDLAFELDNTKSLCVPCHSRITAIEVGITPIDPARAAWRDLVAMLAKPQPKEKVCCTL